MYLPKIGVSESHMQMGRFMSKIQGDKLLLIKKSLKFEFHLNPNIHPYFILQDANLIL